MNIPKNLEVNMLRTIASWIFLMTGVVIGLGAFGHDSNAAKLAAEFAKFPAFDATTARIALAVWHFCSGCMLTFGGICVWTWWCARRDARATFFPTDLIGVFYVAAGLLTVWYTQRAFFVLFVVLGISLIVASLPLRLAPKPSA